MPPITNDWAKALAPEYKKDLTTLFTVAKNDQDAGVVEAANTALAKLEQA